MTELHIPQGFRAAGLACGIKSDARTKDLALFVSESPAAAAGVFTQNQVCGAPVHVSRSRLPAEDVRAVVINSGNANACTGKRGIDDAEWMTDRVAEPLQAQSSSVLVCSTGIIGHFLPRPQLEQGLREITGRLDHSPASFRAAAEAMMTTDTFPKLASRQLQIGERTVSVLGAAKGAAMIAPNMATMLAVVLTDAQLTAGDASELLKSAVDPTFNCISVDGHTSTSDSVMLLANGRSGAAVNSSSDHTRLATAVTDVCRDLATDIIRDGEGAEHLITIEVRGLATTADARRIAQSVAESPLVKTAVTGADPNWGRIVSAAGYAGVAFREEQTTLRINDQVIYKDGAPVEYDEAGLSQQMRDQREVLIRLDFSIGEAGIDFWTTDLTAEYVRLNSEYTT